MDSNNQKPERTFKKYLLPAIIGGIFAVIAAVIPFVFNKYWPNHSAEPVIIDLEKTNELTQLDVTWRPWKESGITVDKDKEKINEYTINSNGKIGNKAAGFLHEGLHFLRGKILILYFSNIEQSEFFDNHLVKLEYRNNDPVIPSNAALIGNGWKGYIDATEAKSGKGIEFVIDPGKFKGRLNFVFYQADLKDLKITAWYK